MKTTVKKKKSLGRRLLSILLWLMLSMIFIFIIAYIIIRIRFPPEKIKQFIASELSNALNKRPVTIGSASVNILKGFELNDVVIYEPFLHDSTTQDSSIFLSLHQAHLNYRFLPLLKRNVKINKILVDRPQIHLKIDKQGRTNIEDLLAPAPAKIDTTKAVTDTTTFRMPISFELNKFEFNHFDGYLSVATDSLKTNVEIKDLSIAISDFVIPRGSIDEIRKNLKIKLDITSPKADWNLYFDARGWQNPYQINTRFDLDVDLTISGMQHIPLAGKIGFGEMYITEFANVATTNKVPVSELLSVTFDLALDAEHGAIDIRRFVTCLADEDALSIHGKVMNLFDEPTLALTVDDSRIRLAKVLNAVKEILPAHLKQEIREIDVTGILSLKDTKLQGNPNSETLAEALKFNGNFDLKNFSLSYPFPKTDVDSLMLSVNVNGIYNKHGLHDTHLDGEIQARRLKYDVDDTMKIAIRDFSTKVKAEISNEYFPTYVNWRAEIGEMFGASLKLDLDFQSQNTWHDYVAHMHLAIQKLQLKSVPYAVGSGLLSMALSLNSTSLDDILVTLQLTSDSLYLPSTAGQLVVKPLNLQSTAALSTNEKLVDIKLKKIELTANDFLTFNGNAELKELGAKGLVAHIDSCLLEHRAAFAFLPASLKEGIENLNVGGKTMLQAHIRGKLPESGEPEIQLTSTATIDAQVDYPEIPLQIANIAGNIEFDSDMKSASAELNADLENLLLADIRNTAIESGAFHLICHAPDLTSVQIDSGLITIPDLASCMSFQGNITNLDKNPIINLDIDYNFDTENPAVLITDLSMTGNLTSLVKVIYEDPLLTLIGAIDASHLKLAMTDLFQVQELSAVIPFSQKIDMNSLALINDNVPMPLLADIGAINYPLFRTYQHSGSYVNINKVQVTGYEISDIDMDLVIGDGLINIPFIGLNLYEGNMQGNLIIDLGNGEPGNVTYFLKANISRLNSAKLSPKGTASAKSSELNMNFELKGTGMDLTKELDLDGFLYITKIGSQFTDNVLNSLDPKGTDKSIQSTKKMLKWGYKPRLISFEIKHGHLYPSIHLMKGTFLTKLIPLNLSGGKVELARIPIKFVLKTAMETQ